MKNLKLWALSCSLLFLFSCSTDENVETENNAKVDLTEFTSRTSTTQNSNTFFGDPSSSSTTVNNLFLEKTGYSLSYNKSRAIANWSAWHLGAGDVGSSNRSNDFRADTALPSTFFRAAGTEYSNSGFDRGHLCPSGDRTSGVTRNSETFLMTNIFPQAPKCNQVTWGNLEDYGRTLVSQGKEIYIYAGTYGTGGVGSNGGTTNSIFGGKIAVPARVWKVMLVLDSGSGDVGRVTSLTRIIAVNMPNSQVINSDWRTYRVTTDSLETLLGYDFFAQVATTIQASIEGRTDTL